MLIQSVRSVEIFFHLCFSAIWIGSRTIVAPSCFAMSNFSGFQFRSRLTLNVEGNVSFDSCQTRTGESMEKSVLHFDDFLCQAVKH